MEYSNQEVKAVIDDLSTRADKTINVLVDEYNNIRTGRANPKILEKIQIDYYGTMSAINQVGNISIPESRTIVIAPWESSMLKAIEKAILQANIGLTPSNDGKVVRLTFPEVTAERRKDLVKQCKTMGEDAKVAVRNIRRDCMDKLKKMKTGKTISEDEQVNYEKEVEKIVLKCTEEIDRIYKGKEKEVTSV